MIADDIVREAARYDGQPYVFGELDCSGYVLRVYNALGLGFSPGVRTAEQIRQACMPKPWTHVQRGDLLFLRDTYESQEPPGSDGVVATHVAISLGTGSGKVWSAQEPSVRLVTISGNEWWQSRLIEARCHPSLATPSVWWWEPAEMAAVTSCTEGAIRNNWTPIAAALQSYNVASRPSLAAAIATIAIETASMFAPVEEAFWLGPESRLAYYLDTTNHAEYSGGPQYHGRGYIQLTHDYNYRRASEALGIDLVANPDLALSSTIAPKLFAWYWASRGIGTIAESYDWREVRRIVQGGTAGLDRLIAMTTRLLGGPS